MNIQEEKRMYLERELADYEESTPMTDEERQALHEWVASGRSVHDNGSYACWEGGEPMDFLDVYRAEKNEQEFVDALSDEDRKRYLQEQYGIIPNP